MGDRATSLTRRAILQIMGAAAIPSLARAEAFSIPETPPFLLEDYAVARTAFRTHLTRIGPSPDPAEPLDAPSGAMRVAYASDGRDLAAWLSLPAGRPAPALVYLHGGNVLGAGHWDLTQVFRQAGYAVIMPALRGENGQGGAFSGFYDENADVLAAAACLAEQPGVNRGRLFVAGHSIGGTQTLLAAMSTGLFRGAAAFSGPTNAWRFFARFPEMIAFDTGSPREFQMRSPVLRDELQMPGADLLRQRGKANGRSEPAHRRPGARGRTECRGGGGRGGSLFVIAGGNGTGSGVFRLALSRHSRLRQRMSV
jgi:poly(3-hydroxybutyrate) depolymerase